MSEVFYFKPNPTVQDVIHTLDNARGIAAIETVYSDYSGSIAEIIAATHQYGHTTVVTLPDDSTIKLVHLTEGDIRRDFHSLEKAFGI
jgi:hypothetical protein